MNKLLSFKEEVYRDAFYNNILDNVKNEYGFGKIKNWITNIRDTLVNYTPVIGHLPVSIQMSLKNNFKWLFGGLDVRTSTLSSAFLTLIFVSTVMLWMDGFDIGYSEEVSRGWWKAGITEYRSYIGQYLPFLGLEFGFPKIYTLVLSVYLMVSSVLRIIANLFGKPIGTFILEIPISIMNRFSEKSDYKQKAEKTIKDSQKLSDTIDTFTEKSRREKEKVSAENTLEAFKRGAF
jgi:hypothetical protein